MIKNLVLVVMRWLSVFRLRSAGCSVGKSVIINGLPYVRRKGDGRIYLGERVTINAARWSNWLGTPGAMIFNVENGAVLRLGRGAGVSSSQLIANVAIEIGENSMVGAGCLICDSDMHEVPLASGRPVGMAPIRIGRGVFIGARCIVLKGVTIGDGTVVGAGSVVTRNLPAGVLACGNPAQIVRRNIGGVHLADPHSNGVLDL
jgi:acetyltransferase-like isoleucine patch superfamily enzyme